MPVQLALIGVHPKINPDDTCPVSQKDLVAAGIGRAEGDLGQLAKMAYRPDAAQRWRRAKVLVIDEVCLSPSHSDNPHL